MATHSSILAWEIPERESGGLQSVGSQKESDTTWRLNHEWNIQPREEPGSHLISVTVRTHPTKGVFKPQLTPGTGNTSQLSNVSPLVPQRLSRKLGGPVILVVSLATDLTACSESESESRSVVSDSLRPHGPSMEFSRPEYWSG